MGLHCLRSLRVNPKVGKALFCSLSFQVHPGDHVIDQGDDGDNFYVIDG